jgi:hypothetical protein
MANINVKKRLEKLDTEINQVGQHILHYSGIDAKDAMFIERIASDICETAAQIVQLAEDAQGMKSQDRRKKVRKALGFTTP